MFETSILFMLAASWFYFAFMLARVDRRWFAGRIIQCIVMGAIPAVCFWQSWISRDVLITLGAAFMLFAMYPTALERRILDGLMAGAHASGARLLLLQLLSWDRSARALRALQTTAQRTAEWSLDRREEATAELVATFARKSGPRTRSRYITPLTLLLIRGHRWSAAADIFERVFADLSLRASPELLMLMVRPYAELGRTRRAFAFLKATADYPLMGEYEDERVLSSIALFALSGRGEELSRLIERHHEMLAALPRAFDAYWRGVADLASGDALQAQDKFQYALGLARQSGIPGEREAWQNAITLRMEEGPAIRDRAVAAPLNDDQAAELLAIDDKARREAVTRPAGAAVFGKGLGPVTAALIGVNIAVWLAMYIAGADMSNLGIMAFGANVPLLVSYEHQYWRLVSSMFIHIGWLHLAFNSYALYLFGTFLERWCRSRRTFLIYMAAGLVGSAASVTLGQYTASAGASGAIMGLLGASIAVIFRFRRRMPTAVRNLYLINFIAMALLTLLFGFIQKGIDNYAHAGGLFTGAIVGLFMPECLPAAVASLPAPASAGKVAGGRARRWMMNGLVVFFIALLAYAGWQATANAVAGGYPVVAPRLVERGDVQDGVALSAPEFWEERKIPDKGYTLKDPLTDAEMEVTAQPLAGAEDWERALEEFAAAEWLKVVAAAPRPRGIIARPSRFELGGLVFYTFRYEVPVPVTETHETVSATVDVYLTIVSSDGGGDRCCRIEFQTLTDDYDRFLPLIRRIVSSVRPIPAHTPPVKLNDK